MRSQKMILISFMVTLASGAMAYYLPEAQRRKTLWGRTKAGGDLPPMRFFIGVGIVYFGISAVGEFKPSLAGPFSALVMTTAGMFNGVPVLEYLMLEGKVPVISTAPVYVTDTLTDTERQAPIQQAAGDPRGGGFAGLNTPAPPTPKRRVSSVNAHGRRIANVKIRMKANGG